MLKSLRMKVMFNFGLFLVLIIGIFFLTYVSIDRQNDEIRLMNLASEQQMLIQRLAKDALLVLQGNPNAINSLKATQTEIDEALKILENGDEELDIQPISDPVALERFEQLKTEWAAFSPNIQVVTGDELGNTLQAINNIAADSEAFVATMNSVVDALRESSEARINASLLIQGALLIIGFGVVAVGWFLMNFWVVRPMQRLNGVVQAVAQNDLTVKADIRTEDEVGHLARNVNLMVDHLREMVHEIRSTSEELNASSEEMTAITEEAARATEQIAETISQVAAGTGDQSRIVQDTVLAVEELRRAIEQIAQGAQQQSEVVQRTTATVSRMSAGVQGVAANANEMAASARETVEVAREGGRTVQQTVSGMEEIRASVLETAEKVRRLGDHSERVGEIVQVISDIAAQTNLLALNAAIEAARAGDHGKGFAVVADEVRKLAERSASSAEEITHLIDNMREGIADAVAAMELGTDKVESGTELAQRAGGALAEILNALEVTNEQIQAISHETQTVTEQIGELVTAFEEVNHVTEENSAAAEEMAAHSDRVANAMESIAAVSEQTAASAEQVSASAEEMNASNEEVSNSAHSLSEVAQQLRQLVAQFKV